MPEDAVMDAAVDTTNDTANTTNEDSQVAETTDQEQNAGTGEDTANPTIEAPTKPLIDGGKLSAEAKATLDKLKIENPPLARAIQRALYKEAEYAKELPNGLKDVRELRQTIETLGGPQGIDDIQKEIGGFREFDQQYTAADPKAIEFMTADPAGQEAFVKLMPAALQKFEQLHPEGFQNYMAQVIAGTVGSYGIPLALERLGDFIADNPKAMEQWSKIAGFVKTMGDLAQKQVHMPKREAAAPDGERAKFESERVAFEREKWKTETAGPQAQVFQSEWARLANGRKVSAEQDAAIRELFESRMNKAIASSDHGKNLDRYFAAKDKTGFLRYADKLNKEELPKALRAAFDAIMPARPGPRPGAPPPAKNGAPARGVPIAQGFTQVAQRPATAEISMNDSRNTPKLFQEGKAFLKGGKAVQWQK